MLPDVFVELSAVVARRLPCQDEEGERPQAEHVQGTRVAVGSVDFGGEVGLGGGLNVFDEGVHRGLPDVLGVSEAADPLPGRGLPVGDPQPRIVAVEFHPDAAGRERPVEQPVAVGVVDCFGELADHLHAGVDVEVGAFLLHEVVETLPAFAVFEHDRGTVALDFDEVFGFDYAFVGDPDQGAVFAFRGSQH